MLLRSSKLPIKVIIAAFIGLSSLPAASQTLDPVTDPPCSQEMSDILSAMTENLADKASVTIPPGVYRIRKPWKIGATTPYIRHNVKISGYGVTVAPCTDGPDPAFSALEVRFNNPPYQLLIEGVKIKHEGNLLATAGFELINSAHVRLIDTAVIGYGTNPNYAAYWLHNSVSGNQDTGSFWNVIDRCTIRPESGGQGLISTGIKLQGAANATTVQSCAIQGVNTGILLVAESQDNYLPNGVLVQGNWIEGFSQAIKVSAANVNGTWRTASGLRILNNRAENSNYNVDTIFFRFGNPSGTVPPVYPPVVAFNYLVGVRYLLENDAGLPIALLDSPTDAKPTSVLVFGN